MALLKTVLVGVENCSYSFDTLFTYLVPERLCEVIECGIRVLVPFSGSNKLRQAFVFQVSMVDSDESKASKLKYVDSVLDSVPVLSDEMLMLASWLRDRCFCTYFVAAKSLLPGGMCLKTEKTYTFAPDIPPEKFNSLTCDEKLVLEYLLRKKSFVRESMILKRISAVNQSPILKLMVKKGLLIESSDAFTRVNDLSVRLIRISDNFSQEREITLTDKQRSVISVLRDIGAASVKELTYFTGVSEAVVRNLVQKGFCEAFDAEVRRQLNSFVPEKDYIKPVLSPEQQHAYNRIYAAYKSDEKKSALLYGVTGSGKTSVYLELIDSVISEGKAVVVLVPEISLTPQTFAVFSGRYGNNVAVLHSALSAGERYEQYKRIRDGEVNVVIGTRSAVFAPVRNLGLIVIDEEQEHTYKSEMSPRYNAKDVARFRCAYHSAFLLLASATPSVETYAKASEGKMELVELSGRYGKAVLPEVYTVDMTDKSQLSSFFAISNPLAQEIENNLNNKEQTILLVNRRGFNTFVVCSDCKKVVTCPKCSISMTYHSANNRLMCHYCGYSIPFAVNCPSCNAENIRYSGIGTQRVEKELQIRFPQARVVRMDADTTSTKNSHEKVLRAFADGEYDILIGTQMVAKGLDFPNVTLVGITSADKELYNNDYRSGERSFDLITQVVGRAGRGNKKGRAVIQTVSPDNFIIDIASRQDYKRFFDSEIRMRKALIYPPFCDLCEIGIAGPDDELVVDCAKKIFGYLVNENENDFSDQKIIILGPMAPKVSKVNELYRQRILIKCKNSKRFRDMINIVLKKIFSDRVYKNINVFADINPEKLS